MQQIDSIEISTVGVMRTLIDYFVTPISSDETETTTTAHDPILIDDSSSPANTLQQCNSFKYAVAAADSNDPGEDRTCTHLSPDLSVFAVFDGHGGNLACDIAKATLVESICLKINALNNDDTSDDAMTGIINQAFQECDALILGEAQQLVNGSMTTDAAAAASTQSNRAGRNSVMLRESKKSYQTSNTSGRYNPTVPVPIPPRRCWNGKEYFDVMGKKPERAGSCAVLGVFRGKNDLIISHVGDCRAFLLSRLAAAPATPLAGSVSNCSLDSMLSSGAGSMSGREHLRRSPRGKKRSCSIIKSLKVADCTEDYGVTDAGFTARSLTIDHSCEVEAERTLVLGLTSDPSPFRPSRGDVEALGSRHAPMRVAGSLSVTRALGDGYLKLPGLSTHPYEKHLPYITCNPSIRRIAVKESDIGLILASDGFWNNVSVSESILVVEEEILQYTNDPASAAISANLVGFKRKRTDSCLDIHVSNSGDDLSALGATAISTEQRIANSLLKKCVDNAAIAYNMSGNHLRKMPPGQKRRDIIDDVTVMVILFDSSQQQVLSSAIGSMTP